MGVRRGRQVALTSELGFWKPRQAWYLLTWFWDWVTARPPGSGDLLSLQGYGFQGLGGKIGGAMAAVSLVWAIVLNKAQDCRDSAFPANLGSHSHPCPDQPRQTSHVSQEIPPADRWTWRTQKGTWSKLKKTWKNDLPISSPNIRICNSKYALP